MDNVSLNAEIPDNPTMENKEPNDDAASQSSYNYSKSPSFEKDSVKDNSVNGSVASVKHDDGEIEKSLNGSSASLKNDTKKENNSMHNSRTSLKHDDGEIEKSINGSSASLKNDAEKANDSTHSSRTSMKQDDGEIEKSINGSSASLKNDAEKANDSTHSSRTSMKQDDGEIKKSINGSSASLKDNGPIGDEENEKKSLNDSALDTTNPDQTYEDHHDATQENDSAVGETKSLNDSINDDKTSVKSDKGDNTLEQVEKEETASINSRQSVNSQEDTLKLTENTGEEQQPVILAAKTNDSDDNKSEKSLLDDNIERESLKSAGNMSVSSKRSGKSDALVVGAAALTTNDKGETDNENGDDIGDDKKSNVSRENSNMSETEKTSVKEQSSVLSHSGSIENVALAVGVVGLQHKNKAEDGDDASVETVSLGDEQVTGETKKLSDKDSGSDSSDEDNDNKNEVGDFVYDLFDSSSDDSDNDETKKEKVHEGPAYPTYAEDFDSLHFHDDVLKGIYAVGMEKPNDLQSKSLPHALKWKDCVIQAPAGSGKTTMYVNSSLNLLPRTTNRASAKSGVRVLVICPTRESCNSVLSQFQEISKFMSNVSMVTLAGGKNQKQDRMILQKGRPNIVIGTPARISACMKKKHLGLSQLKVLIFENSDMMSKTKEFKAAVYQIFKKSPKKKQLILTTATPTPEMKPYMKEPFEILTENSSLISQSLNQYYTNVVDIDEKKQTLRKILEQVTYKQCIIFANSAETCNEIVQFLQEKEIQAAAFHSSVDQTVRVENYENFCDHKNKILVTTDVLSRVTASYEVDLVVNYDMPASDLSWLVHRVTKAVPIYASSRGIAVSFLESSNIELFQQGEKEYGFTAKELPSNLAEVRMPEEITTTTNNENESVEKEGDKQDDEIEKDEANIGQMPPDETKGDEDTQNSKQETDSITHNPSEEQEVAQNDQPTTNIPTAAASQQQGMNGSSKSLKDSVPKSRQQSANSYKQQTRRDSKLSIASVKSNQKDKTCVCIIL